MKNLDIIIIEYLFQLTCGSLLFNMQFYTDIIISGAFACVFGEFHFDRKFEYYLLQTYFPSLLVVMLSWVSFWIDPAAVPARISLGLLTVLTMTTQASVLNSRLPRFLYVTYM